MKIKDELDLVQLVQAAIQQQPSLECEGPAVSLNKDNHETRFVMAVRPAQWPREFGEVVAFVSWAWPGESEDSSEHTEGSFVLMNITFHVEFRDELPADGLDFLKWWVELRSLLDQYLPNVENPQVTNYYLAERAAPRITYRPTLNRYDMDDGSWWGVTPQLYLEDITLEAHQIIKTTDASALERDLTGLVHRLAQLLSGLQDSLQAALSASQATPIRNG